VSGDASKTKRLVRDLKVSNHYGVHARPAALFVKAASQFDADIEVEKDGNVVSGKSIMGLMTLEAGPGSVLRVSAEGPDSETALDFLEQLVVKRKFDEG
jgi:phosphocarrier protein HPr